MSYYFPTECRRWAPICSVAGFFFFFLFSFVIGLPFAWTVWVDGMGSGLSDNVGMRVCIPSKLNLYEQQLINI